jgi:hypothetical protein
MHVLSACCALKLALRRDKLIILNHSDVTLLDELAWMKLLIDIRLLSLNALRWFLGKFSLGYLKIFSVLKQIWRHIVKSDCLWDLLDLRSSILEYYLMICLMIDDGCIVRSLECLIFCHFFQIAPVPVLFLSVLNVSKVMVDLSIDVKDS